MAARPPATAPRAPSPPVRIDLGGPLSSHGWILGAAIDEVLAGSACQLILDLGPNATDPTLLGTFSRWVRRNEALPRSRARAMVFVVPSLWHALQWRLVGLLERPVVPSVVVRTETQALTWLASRAEDRLRQPGGDTLP